MKALKAHLRKLLLALGVVALIALVRHVGVEAVMTALWLAGPWFPLIVFLETFVTGTDALALALFYGPFAAQVPRRAWLRSTAMHFAVMVALPAGRAGAEATRAAMLAPFVGGPRASAAAVQVQCVTLLANTFISALAYIAVLGSAGPENALGWLLLGNGGVTAVVGIGIYLGTRRLRVGGWLGRRLAALSEHGPEVDRIFREAPTFPLAALAVACAGRLFQTVQYAVLLVAVGGSVGVTGALIAEGIHLVGAGLGDMVPNQVGVTEAAYGYFSDTLGLSTAAGVTLALVARLAQFTLAAIYFTIANLVAAAKHPHAASPSTPLSE